MHIENYYYIIDWALNVILILLILLYIVQLLISWIIIIPHHLLYFFFVKVVCVWVCVYRSICLYHYLQLHLWFVFLCEITVHLKWCWLTVTCVYCKFWFIIHSFILNFLQFLYKHTYTYTYTHPNNILCYSAGLCCLWSFCSQR